MSEASSWGCLCLRVPIWIKQEAKDKPPSHNGGVWHRILHGSTASHMSASLRTNQSDSPLGKRTSENKQRTSIPLAADFGLACLDVQVAVNQHICFARLRTGQKEASTNWVGSGKDNRQHHVLVKSWSSPELSGQGRHLLGTWYDVDTLYEARPSKWTWEDRISLMKGDFLTA